MEVALPAKLETFVRAQVRSGRYVDAQDVVRDALRRLQESEVPDAELSGIAALVHEALVLADQAQQDVRGLVKGEAVTTDWRQEILGYATSTVNMGLDIARYVPLARDVERRLRGSVDQLTAVAERGERQTRQLRQGLETTARALEMLTAVLETVSDTTSRLGRAAG